jgi:hypothetical protein
METNRREDAVAAEDKALADEQAGTQGQQAQAERSGATDPQGNEQGKDREETQAEAQARRERWVDYQRKESISLQLHHGLKRVGFLAVSATAAKHAIFFPIMPGFDQTEPRNDLRARLKMAPGDWVGHVVLIVAADSNVEYGDSPGRALLLPFNEEVEAELDATPKA